MAFDARRRVEDRTQSGAWIVSSFKLRLIQGEGVAGRLCDPVTDALRAGIRCYFPCRADRLSECGSGKAGWRFSRGLLRDERNCGGYSNKRKGDLSVCHWISFLEASECVSVNL